MIKKPFNLAKHEGKEGKTYKNNVKPLCELRFD